MSERPVFNPAGLPAFAVERAVAHALNSWCWVNGEGHPFFGFTEEKARRMLAEHGGEIFPPAAA